MKKILFITSAVAVLFIAEFTLFNFISYRILPNLLLLFVIFVNLSFGIRYSIYAAVLSGLLKDCFNSDIFGIYLLSFVLCAYLTTFLSQILYHSGSGSARLLLVLFVSLTYVLLQYFLFLMTVPINFVLMVKHILFPETLATLIVTPFMFKQFKKCVLRLFV